MSFSLYPHSGFSSTGSISVSSSLQVIGFAQGSTGILMEHVSSGNYRVRNIGGGTFQVQNPKGDLILSSGTSGGDQLTLQSGVTAANTIVTLDSNGSVLFAGPLYLQQQKLVSVRTVGVSVTSTNLITNEMAFFVGGASGASLALRSGGIIYFFNSAATTVG